MLTGPLYADGADRCECQIVNVTTTAKTVSVLLLNANGGIIRDSGPISLGAGHVLDLIGNAAGQQYCKFVNASPTYFRANLACFGTPDPSDNVALPAR